MSTKSFDLQFNGHPIVYVRPVKTGDLPVELRKDTGDLTEIYAIHSGENGACIALAKDRSMAFALARHNDLSAVSVH